ncbi:MAG: hypothetical protein PHV20_07735 [Bacteroidales bacterium]|nr:hypothetical protein [Bacteroidales bacterium]
MKEESSWIYVVIMIIVSLISTFGKKKKQPNLERTPPINEEKEEEEFFPPVQPANVRVIRKKKIIQAATDTTLAPELLNDNSQPSMNQSKKPLELFEEESAPLSVRFENVEDAKTAFLYSEIFNRKY